MNERMNETISKDSQAVKRKQLNDFYFFPPIVALTVFVVHIESLKATSLIHAGKFNKLLNQTTSTTSTTEGAPGDRLKEAADEIPDDEEVSKCDTLSRSFALSMFVICSCTLMWYFKYGIRTKYLNLHHCDCHANTVN